MNCDPLAFTGPATNIALVLVLALVVLLTGTGLLLVARKRGRAARAALLVVLLVAAVLTLVPAPPALAAANDCSTATNSLTVTQTSTMQNMAPGTAPATITGLVRNIGPDSTYVIAVRVEITSVTSSARAPAGSCDPSDYVLVEPLMPVGRTLEPGGSTSFAGASIGLNDKLTNQDACKHAVVHLLYTANPA